ncbi:MAG TPA: PAS domain-containing protein [Terriglobia bacterium]|nr:PAS domain-containing protein [Terriglobia bacterium]
MSRTEIFDPTAGEADNERIGQATELDPRFRQLFDYWSARCGEGRLPGRGQIRPEELPGLLPYLVLYDIVTLTEGYRFRVRLIGTHFVGLLGKEISGRFLDEVAYAPRYAELHQRLVRVIDTKQPDFGIASLNNPERDFIQYGHLTLPLAEDGEHVDMLLGARIALDSLGTPLRSQHH